MSKSSKKRNKPYQGADAKTQTPTVRRYTAVMRSPLSEWWHTRKRLIKIVAIIVGVMLVVVWLIVEAIRWIF